jgi:hypothetical protein
MGTQTNEIAITGFIRQIVERLEQAAGVAKAAQACAEARQGSLRRLRSCWTSSSRFMR